MKLSRSVVYAVQAVLQLALDKSGQPVPCSQLAAQGHMPERFLLQVLRHLVTHDILHSTRGVEGGYALQREPGQISLLQVIEAIDGPLGLTWPETGDPESSGHLKIRELLGQVSSSSREQLAAIKISDLIDHSSRVKVG
jgi:Rrf2 family protein